MLVEKRNFVSRLSDKDHDRALRERKAGNGLADRELSASEPAAGAGQL